MKRHRDLWPRLASFANLLAAFHRAVRGKRHLPGPARFSFHLERELHRLADELRDGSYRPGPYFTFEIHEPKRRLISAAPFRDRIVHHALINVLEPIWEPVFIADSYACRRGKGTHAAVDRFQEFARRHSHVLQCDVRKYFPSIDHQVLKARLTRKVKDGRVLDLANQIIDHSNPQEPVEEYFPGDDLFTPSRRRRGLPLGNQTSQFFANVYLDPLDHFVKQTLRYRGYVRYMDDFALFGDDPAALARAREDCRQFLVGLRLRLHPSKAAISRVEDGSRFLGYRVFPTHRLLPRANVVRMRRRLRRLQADYATGVLDWPDVRRSLAGWLGHAGHADTWRLREGLFAEYTFQRGP